MSVCSENGGQTEDGLQGTDLTTNTRQDSEFGLFKESCDYKQIVSVSEQVISTRDRSFPGDQEEPQVMLMIMGVNN